MGNRQDLMGTKPAARRPLAVAALFALMAVLPLLPAYAAGGVVVLGDSITVGDALQGSYPDRLSQRLGCPVANLGQDGADTFDGVEALDMALMEYRPGVVVIFYGANDAIMGYDPADSAQNLRFMVARVKAAGALPILATVMPMFGGRRIFNSRVTALNALIVELAEQRGVEWADLHALFLGREERFPDGLHPDAVGLEAIAGAFAEAIGASERAHWPDLAIRGLKLVPAAPAPGARVRVCVTVENLGDVAAMGGQLEVWLNRGDALLPNGAADGSVAVGWVAAHHVRTFAFSARAPATGGDLICGAWVDSRRSVLESAEDNNQAALPYPCKPLSRLTVTGPAVVDEGVVVPYRCTAQFEDGTSADVTEGGTTWSEDTFYATISGSGLLATRGTLVADQGCTVTAAYGGCVAERAVTIRNSLRPDYDLRALSLSPVCPLAGRYFAVYVTVGNRGTVAGRPAYLTVRSNRDPLAPLAGSGVVHMVVPALAPAQRRVFVAWLRAPADRATATLCATVDNGGRMVELTDTNNQATLDYAVGALPVMAP